MRTQELFKINAEVRKIYHAITIANRLKDRHLWKAENEPELVELRRKYTALLLKRAEIEGIK